MQKPKIVGDNFVKGCMKAFVEELKRDFTQYCQTAQVFEESPNVIDLGSCSALVARTVKNLKSVLKSLRFE